jgi:hypothetical protein
MKNCIFAFLVVGLSMLHGAETRNLIQVFSPPSTEVPNKNSRIDYELNLEDQTFFVHIPANYDGSKAFGLIVYIPAADRGALPHGWEPILEQRNMLFVRPQKAINSMATEKRLGLGVIAATKMQEDYRIDPKRVYAAGTSGGARMASMLGFYQSDLFRGTVQSCGSNFPRPVLRVRGVIQDRDNGEEYGIMAASDAEYESAKIHVRFVIITGPADFRYENLHDLYDGGYKKHGFSALLIDDPVMTHEPCSGESLRTALDFIEKT